MTNPGGTSPQPGHLRGERSSSPHGTRCGKAPKMSARTGGPSWRGSHAQLQAVPGLPAQKGLRHVFKVKGPAGVDGRDALDRLLAWAAHYRIPVFVPLGSYPRIGRMALESVHSVAWAGTSRRPGVRGSRIQSSSSHHHAQASRSRTSNPRLFGPFSAGGDARR